MPVRNSKIGKIVRTPYRAVPNLNIKTSFITTTRRNGRKSVWVHRRNHFTDKFRKQEIFSARHKNNNKTLKKYI